MGLGESKTLGKLVSVGEIKIEDNLIKMQQSKGKENKEYSYIKCFGSMLNHLVDSYQIVLMAVSEVCTLNYIVKEDNLVKELHQAILSMFNVNLIPQLMSCLEAIIYTALNRYTSLGLLSVTKYT